MYYQHVWEIAKKHPSQTYQEWMTHPDYFFRYDPGAFWMGAYVFHFPLSVRMIKEGLMGLTKRTHEPFNENQIARFHNLPETNQGRYTFMRPWLRGKSLCKMLHQAETWIQNRFVIQDFCIPEHNAASFLTDICKDTGIFPLWLLPLKGTSSPQIFAPHLLPHGTPTGRFINFGLYGIPSYSSLLKEITQHLEQLVTHYGGRKALYSRSYYDQNAFWKIYNPSAYQSLREETLAKGTWHEITAKVLSE